MKDIHLISGSYLGSENNNNIYYRPFTTENINERISNSYYPKRFTKNNFEYVNKKIPELDLQGRYNSWSGFLYYYIVYELKVNDTIGLAVTFIFILCQVIKMK